jgi:hypothetical protein
MVQAAYLGERDDLALVRPLHWSWFRGILVQAQVGPTPVTLQSGNRYGARYRYRRSLFACG